MVRSSAAATLERVGSHALHSIRESVFLRSPLTETPRTAFLVHSERPSRRTPHASFTGLRRRSPPLWWLGESGSDALALPVDLRDSLVVPWLALEVIDSYGDARLAGDEARYLAPDPSW